jgi:uncharacterized glyoxalase superfamily protein PhnB
MAETHPNTFANAGVECEKYHACLAVGDVRAAIQFYTEKLGFWLAFAEGTPANFAGVNLGGVQVFLEQGTPASQGCSLYFVVNDADRLYQLHRSAGVEIIEPPGDRAYALHDYTVRDNFGYRLTFGHHPKCSYEPAR